MLQSLPFLAGLIAGAALVGTLRGERARGVMNDAGARLRGAYGEVQRGAGAAVRSGFDLFRGGAKPEPPTEAPPPETAPPAAPAPSVTKPARKAATPRKPAAAKATEAKAAAPKPKHPPRKAKPAEA